MSTIHTITESVLDEATPTSEPDEVEAEDTEGDADADQADVLDGIAVVQVDPATVKIEANVRTQVTLDPAFVRTIKRHGILIPVLAYQEDDGTVVVRDGQRRVLAAVQSGRGTIPAYLVPVKDEARLRIIQQMIANEQRAGLTDNEEAAALHQLTLEGLTPTMIAKELAVKPARVKAAVAVAANEAAKAAVAKFEVTFEQALVLAEFEGDADVQKDLRRAAARGEGDFAHEAQRQRDRKEAREQVAALIADLKAQGYHQIAWPSYDDKDTRPFDDLTKADGTALTEQNYLGGDGHRFAVRESGRGVEVGHFVTDWKKWGLKKRKANGDPALAWTEEQKAERKELIANNKAWDSAEKVRRAWLTTFLSRKTLPKDALAFTARTAATNGGQFSKEVTDRHRLARTLLGIGEFSYSGPDSLIALIEHQPGRVGHVLTALALAAHEAATGKHTWRNPSPDARAYFTALAAWGYSLSDVEQIVLGVKAVTPSASLDPDEDAEPQEAEPDEDEFSDVVDEDDLAA